MGIIDSELWLDTSEQLHNKNGYSSLIDKANVYQWGEYEVQRMLSLGDDDRYYIGNSNDLTVAEQYMFCLFMSYLEKELDDHEPPTAQGPG